MRSSARTMDGIITDWNRGAERLYGYSAQEMIGRPISLLMPADRSDDFQEIVEKLKRGEKVAHYETVRQKKDGTRVPKVTGCLGCPRSSRGDVLSACSGNWAIPPKRASPVQRDRSSTPVVTPMSFHCGNPTWETTSARQCCASIFANLFSTRMSSCTF